MSAVNREGIAIKPCMLCIYRSRPGDAMVSSRCQSIRSKHYAKRCSQVETCSNVEFEP